MACSGNAGRSARCAALHGEHSTASGAITFALTVGGSVAFDAISKKGPEAASEVWMTGVRFPGKALRPRPIRRHHDSAC